TRSGGSPMIKLKRAYDKPAPGDGKRILVDSLWPRGISKEKAAVDLWLKDIAPSVELRKWFGHDPAKWKQFESRYQKELRLKKEAVQSLKKETRNQTVTFVFAARDEEHNNALALKRFLER